MQLPNLWKPTEVFGSTFSPMRRDLDELFNKIKWPDLPINIGSNGPALNVAEHKNNFIITAELPGVDMKDVKVTLDRNYLVISGEKTKDQKKDEGEWHVEERSFGSFYRSIMLPFTPKDTAVEATLSRGVLTIIVKKNAELISESKNITIKSDA